MSKVGKIVLVTISIIIVLIIGAYLLFVALWGGAFDSILDRIYCVDNVYEELWNRVNCEKTGTRTVLTTSTEGAYVDYDLGAFSHLCIPVTDEYRVSLSFHQNKFYQDELYIWLFEKNGDNDSVLYVYNPETNTLYGNQEEAYLTEKFMSLYYSWVGNDGKYNSENPGDYTFVFEKYPSTHD